MAMDRVGDNSSVRSGEYVKTTTPDTGPARQSNIDRPSRRRSVRPWFPAVFLAVFTLTVLRLSGVSIPDIAVFFTYIALGLTFPGVLLIRFLYRDARSLTEELALGLALGYVLEVAAYIAARVAGLPLLVLAFPVGTYLLFLVVPRLRGHWRSAPRRGIPLWWSWSITLTVAYQVAWSLFAFFTKNPLTWPALGSSATDTSFHLSLIGEIKHHMPPKDPAVAGEPLFYHWFVHAELAATSWVTGVEPVVLLLRLAMLPMLGALVVLVGMVARRVIDSWPGAFLAVLGAMFMAAPSLYLGKNGIFTWGGIPDEAWASPSQTFGAVLFAPAALLLIDILEGGVRRRSNWLLLTIFLVALTGAKSTYLPLLTAGLIAVATLGAVRSRRLPRTPLIALGITLACLVCAQAVLYRGARQAVSLSPLSITTNLWHEFTGLPGGPAPAAVAGLTLVYLLCWVTAWCGIAGLLTRPGLLMRPSVVMMIGMGGAGLGAVLLLGNSHLNQLYFLRAVYPYMAIVSVYGLVVAVRHTRASLVMTACAAGAGAVAACLIPLLCGIAIPLHPGQPPALLYLPYLVLLALVTLAAIALIVKRGRAGAALTLSLVAAVGLPAAAHARVLEALSRLYPAAGAGPENTAGPMTATALPQGALTAGRWLRGHSGVDDLVATNGHFRWSSSKCHDSRQFWVSALTERRVLVEGWAYSSKNWERVQPGQAPECAHFWDSARLGANDAAFAAPSRESVQRLRSVYGVRWLFADERHAGRIADYATERFRSGDFAVYEIPER